MGMLYYSIKYRNIDGHAARLTHDYSHFVDTFRKSDINIGCKPRPSIQRPHGVQPSPRKMIIVKPAASVAC